MFEDDDEDDIQSTEEALQLTLNMFRWLYFDYMLNEKDATYLSFKKFYLEEIIPEWMDKINNKYADHVEGRKNEKMD